jgi:hypothetical protein
VRITAFCAVHVGGHEWNEVADMAEIRVERKLSGEALRKHVSRGVLPRLRHRLRDHAAGRGEPQRPRKARDRRARTRCELKAAGFWISSRAQLGAIGWALGKPGRVIDGSGICSASRAT